MASAGAEARPALVRALTHQSGAAVDWLADAFGLDVSIVARLAAHSHPRTHRGKERFPGMALTYGLMERLDEIAQKNDGRARVINKAKVTHLIKEGDVVVGVKYEKDGKTYEERGPVIVTTGGFGADFTPNSLLASIQTQWRTMEAWQPTSRAGQQNEITKGKFVSVPSLMTLPTTNGPHCTGDGIKMALEIGAGTYDLHAVQVHPTGIIDPSDPKNKVKFLAAEALRGSGGIIIDAEGNKFCDDLGKRDYVTMRMWQNGKTPHRLILNSKSAALIAWHCEHYQGRGLMKAMTGEELAKEMGVPASKLRATFDEYNEAAKNPNDLGKNKWGKKFFLNVPYEVNDKFMVCQIEPVVHYCMGGIAANEFSEVLTAQGKVIPGVWTAGEAQGGVHGTNRLGGSSLLDCVVYGRIAGRSASKYLLDKLVRNPGSAASSGALSKSAGGVSAKVSVNGNKVHLELELANMIADAIAADGSAPSSTKAAGVADADPNAAFYGQGVAKPAAKGGDDAAKKDAGAGKKTYPMDEVKKHNKDTDCWVVLHNQVYDVTKFLNDHPGGKKAIMLYAGKDATTEFDMLHSKDLLARYGPEFHIGALQGSSKL